jgi:hypothetical protein
MKVLDLQCARLHVFEGWFASEADFQSQCDRGLIECPVCNDASISKKLSAPRLNFGAASPVGGPEPLASAVSAQAQDVLQTALMAAAKHIIANTDDVGSQFAEEACKMHYGECKERGIRGQATREETAALIDEGISVMSLPLPEALKGPLQ